jgi:methylated-DNA-protein-cysteine methyltransferase-like protein
MRSGERAALLLSRLEAFGDPGVSTLAAFRRIIRSVPRGRVITYGQVAEAAGHPRSARLTVWALQGGHDLPWHRVVGAGGRISLRGADGEEQRLRLTMEGVSFRGNRVRIDVHGWIPGRRRGHRRT